MSQSSYAPRRNLKFSGDPPFRLNFNLRPAELESVPARSRNLPKCAKSLFSRPIFVFQLSKMHPLDKVDTQPSTWPDSLPFDSSAVWLRLLVVSDEASKDLVPNFNCPSHLGGVVRSDRRPNSAFVRFSRYKIRQHTTLIL